MDGVRGEFDYNVQIGVAVGVVALEVEDSVFYSNRPIIFDPDNYGVVGVKSKGGDPMPCKPKGKPKPKPKPKGK